ncbi:hypothetical protein [Kitasatospora sp. NPDC048407]|uniref:WXG100-like domain-containing protein n=1 Tax=Kitasatospora sp. NPDC048407 TaxID=3364051 RepID=UPI003715ED53
MAVELPEPLQWVLLLLAGCRWPEADEDQLRDMADHCRKAAETLKDAAQSGDATIKRALEGQQGVAAEALGKYWEKYSVGKGTEQDPGYLPGAINALNGMGDMLEQVANSAETAKIQIIAQLGILAFEIATAEAEAPFTGGLSMLEVPGFIAASKLTVMATLKALLKEMIIMAAKQAAQMAAINLMAQGIELAEGHRKSIDMKEVGESAKGGAIGGASGHLIGKGIGKAGEKLGVETALKSTAGKMATGAAVGVGADVSTQLITTGKVDGNSLLGSGLSGGAGAGLHAGASKVKGHFATPKAAEAPKLPGAGGGAGAGEHGGTPSFNKSDTATGASAYHGPSGGSGAGASRTAESGVSSSGSSNSGSSASGSSHETGSGAGASKVSGLTPFGGGRSGDAPSAGSSAAGHNTAPTPTPTTQEQAASHVQESMAPRAESRAAAPAQESVPRQESVAPTREQATPRGESQSAAQVHESVPRQESVAPAVERSVPRQESVAPVHENVAPRGESQPAAQVHESVPRQESVAPAAERSVPRQESVAPAHENVAPRGESQPAAQVHETTPRQESVAPAREQMAPRSESQPAAPVHESAARQESVAPARENAAPRSESQPAAPAHESVPRQESVNQPGAQNSSAPDGFTPQNDPREPRPSGASAMPNLSGVLDGAGHLAGAGGTHLDGGTRLSAGPATARPAGPEQVAAHLVPDGPGDAPAAASTTQSPMVGAPMAGGFTPGPVGGVGGHGGSGASAHATPSPTVPHQGGAKPATTPNPNAAPAAGTIRPGAGRAPEAGSNGKPTAEQAHDQLLDRQRQERQSELDRLGRATNVRDAVQQLGRTQRPGQRLRRPADADRLRQDMPGMTPEQRAQELANLKPENRRWLAQDPEFVDTLKSSLPPKDFAKVAADLIVHVDPRAEQAPSARHEAQQQVARMLQDPDTAAQLMKSGADVVIVPKDVRMTDVPELHNLRGGTNDSDAGGGRGYDDMRGSGGKHSAVTEENLLGERTTIGAGGHYADGYSTTTHEFSHTLHEHGLTPADKQTITDAFNKKKADAQDPTKSVQWPDGSRPGNYSSQDQHEYFAQATNAYLGTNHGHDQTTGEARNNGPEWVKQHEPDLYPLLKKLYGENPSAIHDGPANPVRETTAQNAAYDGFREFMQHVDGTPTPTGEHVPPATEHTPPAADRTAAPTEHMPPTGDRLPHPPPPATSAEYQHKIDGKKTFETLDRFLSDSPEFQQVREQVRGYDRDELKTGDTNAVLSQYRNEKLQHVDVLSRNAEQLPKAIAKVDERLQAVEHELTTGNHPPERVAELRSQREGLENAKASMQEQRDRMAIFEHERLKDPALARARYEAEVRVLPGSIERIKAEQLRNDALLAQATQHREDGKQPDGSYKNKVHNDRYEDLKTHKENLSKDLTQRENDLATAQAEIKKPAPSAAPAGSTGRGGVEAPASKEAWTDFDNTYRKAFGYSDQGVMGHQPHAEKVVARMENHAPSIGPANINRNHVIADYMVHKYVTAAVFKARAMDEGDHRAASDAFGDFVSAMSPDQHRIYDVYGKKAQARIGTEAYDLAGLREHELTRTPGTVDLKATYGNERLPGAFETTGITDRGSAETAAKNLERELGRSGLDVPAREQLNRLNAAVAEVHPDNPTAKQLADVHGAVGAVHQKIKEQAVDDLALVHGVTGPQKLDEAAAVLTKAAEGKGGLQTPEQQQRLAGKLDDLADHLQAAGKDPKPVRDLAGDLREHPERLTADRYGAVADKLTNDRPAVRDREVDTLLKEPVPKGTVRRTAEGPAEREVRAAQKTVTDREKTIATAKKDLAAAEATHATAEQAAQKSAKAAADNPTTANKNKAEADVKAEQKAKAAVDKVAKKLGEEEAKLPGDKQHLDANKALRDRVKAVYAEQVSGVTKPSPAQKNDAGRVARATVDLETVGKQYGGSYARAGDGAKHPAAMFEQALTAHLDDVPALIEKLTADLSNSASNLRFGDEWVNKWIQNFLDPHIIREPDLLTAVAHEQLPPEVLYAPHTADLLQAVRSLEANGLVPLELRDLMAPKTQADLEHLRTAGKLSDSSTIVVEDLGVPSPHAAKLPVSSSGEFANRADATKLTDEQLQRLGVEGLYRPDHVPQPAPDHDVVMADASQSTAHIPDGDVQMHDGTADAAGPGRKRRRDDSESDEEFSRETARLRLDDPTPPPPPPPPPAATGHGAGTGTRGFGSPAAPPPPPPPAATGHGAGTGTRGFGSPVAPPPPPPMGSVHEGAPVFGHQPPPPPPPPSAVHEAPSHDAPPVHEAPSHEQSHAAQQPPHAEPLLPPPGTVERWLVQNPAELMSQAPVTVNYADGAMQRMPGLNQQQANSFVAAVEKADQHWFTLVPDRNHVGAGKNGFVLTPAWEKYAEHDPSFPRPPAGTALPAPQPDHHYVTGSYVPYKTGRPDPNLPDAIGKTVVPMHPDPSRPNDGLVLTGGMNGCAFAITDVTPHEFTVWHVQSYSASSNLGMTADFRATKSVTDWFGVEEYMTPGQSRPFAVTNMLKHGAHGWEVISHEVVDHGGEFGVGRQNRRPLNFTPPTEADRVRMTVGTYEVTAREQLSNFDRAAELALREFDRNSPGYRVLEQQIGEFRGRLTDQLDTVAALQQPGRSLQDVRNTAQQLADNAAQLGRAANDSKLLIEGTMRALLKEPVGYGADAEPHSRQGKIDTMLEALEPQRGGHWIERMNQDSAKQLQAHNAAPTTGEGFGSPAAGQHGAPPVEHVTGRDVEPMDIETPPSTASRQAPVERGGDTAPREQGGDTAPREQTRNDRKRGREDDEPTLRRETEPTGPQAKRQRTPAYENTDAVMRDRGYQAVGPQHELTGQLVDYLGGAPKLHPPMSNSLLQKVNPHQSPVRPVEGFQPGNDLNACFENVEAYRDTHFGRPRVSGQTLNGTVEPIPGNVLWKRHDGPALFGEGPGAVNELMAKVKAGGPGSFATVLGAGPTGAGHAVALVHDRDGALRWADLTDRRVVAARPGEMPYSFDPSWTVWASVADRHETNISGPHDPQFMERYSTFTRGEPSHDTSEPMDIDDGFGNGSPSRTEALDEHPGGAPNDAAPQPGAPQPTSRTSSGDDGLDAPGLTTPSTPPPSTPGGAGGHVAGGPNPAGGPASTGGGSRATGGPNRPRSASAPAEFGPRTPATPARSETVAAPVRSETATGPVRAESALASVRSETVTEPRTGTGPESPLRPTSPEGVERAASLAPNSEHTPEPELGSPGSKSEHALEPDLGSPTPNSEHTPLAELASPGSKAERAPEAELVPPVPKSEYLPPAELASPGSKSEHTPLAELASPGSKAERAPEVELVPPVPKSEHTPPAEFPPLGRRVPVAGDGYCLLRAVAVGAPELAGPHQLQAAVGDHFRSLRPEDWPTEVVSNYRNNMLGRPDLPAGDLLAYVRAEDRPNFTGLTVEQLRESVGAYLTEHQPLPAGHERAELIRTVQEWDTRWGSTGGEMLPAATAHALGLRLRVVDHDGITQAVFGPTDGRPVTVYRASDHYDGSEPPTHTPETDHTPPPTPEPAPQQLHVTPEVEQPPSRTAPEAEQQQPHTVPETDHTPLPAPEPAPQQPHLAPEPAPQQPAAVAPKPIAGTDLVVGLTGNEAAVRRKVIDVIAQAVPGDRAAARAFADAHFGPATLRPMLGALSRGEVWTAPFEGNGWSGSVKLRGQVTESTHLRTEKIEFENGADRTVATGTNRGAQWQFNVGVQAREGRGIGEPSELVAYYHDRGQAEVNLDLGGMVARSKTSGPAEVFESTMRLELDFGDLRHNGEPVRAEGQGRTEAVNIDLTVAVPERLEAPAAGEQRVPPQRLLDGRVGGQEIVLDLAPRDTAGNRPPVEALLDRADAAGRQEFGGDWPAVREKVLAEVDFARLQRDLKSMTAGEPVSVTLTDRRGKQLGEVEITARVGELRQAGTTKETEFNIGTTVQQVRSTSSNSGHAGQLGFSAAVKPGTGLIGGGGAGRLGRDHVEISGEARTAQLTSKSKVPGVIYDGTVHFDLKFNGKSVAHEAGSADLRVLVDRADTSADTSADATVEHPAERTAEHTATEQQPAEVAAPPDSVWRGGDDRGGLGETVVVRDLESTAGLREALDRKGRERFGEDWNSVRDQVMQGFSQPNLAARLTGMTRGEALEVKIPGKEGLVVKAVARVEEMTYRREDGKAELNTVNETGAFSVARRLGARTTIEQGQLGGAVAKGTPGAELGATASGQQRRRAGGQGRQADRVYASGKYSAPQVIYGARLVVDVHVGRPGEAVGGRPDVSAPVKVEVGLDARETVKVEAPSTGSFTRPEQRPERTAAPAEAATHTAPRRMTERHELNASYVVHSLSGADKVRAAVEDAVRTKHGEPSEEVKQRIGASFDRVALRAQLSQLTRGGRITETVAGKTWSAEVTVTARLGESTYHSQAAKYEFESGTRTSSGQGTLRDSRDRLNGGGQVKANAPFVAVTGGYTYRMDRSYGQATETVGSASNRGKHVEPAVFFDVAVPYDVTVTFKRLGVPDGSHTAPVETVARVAVPMRDAEPVSGPIERTTATQPKGFVEGRRLDSSAIVTDIHALPGPTAGAPRRTLGESVLSQVESGWKPGGLRALRRKQAGQPELTRNPFGRDWAGIRSKLDAELTPDRLQSRLKGMTAGDEIVVRHGRTTVRVGAQLRDRMEYLGDAGTTEFNAGTDVQRSFAHTGGTGSGHQGALGAVASVPVPAAPGVSVTAGVTGSGGRGHDQVDTHNRATATGSATKAKLPGSAYAGEAELQFTISRRPLVGTQVWQRRTAAIGFETLVESGETVPVPTGTVSGSGTVTVPGDGQPRTITVRPPEPVTVQVPPERVWEGGLRDTDVLRWLGDVGGVQDLVRLRGPEYFGKSAWKEMEPVVGTITSHGHLSALFGTATQGMEVSATVPSNRITLGGGKGVEVGVKVVSLEHRAVDDKVELSPANAISAGSTRYDLSTGNAGVQGQVGAKLTGDVTTSPAIVGGVQRLWREGGGHGDAGQVVSNGKFAVPMARYAGHAEVEVTLFNGGRTPVKERGVVPFAVDIPLSETTASEVAGDHYLAFTEQQRSGELRVAEGAWRLAEVRRLLAPDAGPVRTPAEHEQLIGTVRLGQAVYEGEFTASTEAGAAHIRATHQLVELAGGTSEGTAALLDGLLGGTDGAPLNADDVRQVITHIERRTAEGPLTLEELTAAAQNGWNA